MTSFDIFILSMVALSGLFAWIRGLSREIITLLALGLGLMAIVWFGEKLAPMFGEGIAGPLIAYSILFTTGFVLGSIGLGVAWNRLSGRQPHIADKSLGAIFGLVRGWFLMGLVYLASTYYFDENDPPKAVSEAQLKGVVAKAAEILEKAGLERETTDAES